MTTDTKTEDKQDQQQNGEHFAEVPQSKGALVAAAKWTEFQDEVKAREIDFANLLPSHVSKDRFIASAIAAAKQNPDILFATKRSVFAALGRSAQDGLLPDGREGVITVYNQKIKGTNNYEQVAQWNPMAHGLRKRLRELEHIIADVQVVHTNDKFIWHQGDDPRIEHTPPTLGTPRGNLLGAYAIFKRESDGAILHREVMDVHQIEATRNQSKAKDSLMWTTFVSEGYRKSVLRRGVKTVPTGDQMAGIIQRDDEENFDFSTERAASAALIPPSPPTPPPPPVITKQDTVVLPPETPKDPVPVNKPRQRKKGENRGEPPPAEAPRVEPEPAAEAIGLPGDWQDYVDNMVDEIKSAKDASDENAVHETFADTIGAAIEQGRLTRTDAELVREAWDKAVTGLPPRT